MFVGKNFAGKSSYDHDPSLLKVVASKKVLVPGSQNNGSSSLTDQLETPEIVSKDSEVRNFLVPITDCCYMACVGGCRVLCF